MNSDRTEAESKEIKPGVRFAAGGLLTRKTACGLEIAIVQRARYGDWSLPKGKPKEGESWEETALREVKEETGCDAKITCFAGTIQYKVECDAKIVFFWNMTLLKESPLKPSEEVRSVSWLAPDQAIKKLSHHEARALLRQVFRNRRTVFFASLFRRWKFSSLFKMSSRKVRLAASIQSYRVEIECRIKELQKRKPPVLYWVDCVRTSLCKAESELNENNIDKGWKLFHAAQRMEIYGLEKDELKARAEAIRLESSKKLKEWRKDTVDKLLDIKIIDQLTKADDIDTVKYRIYQAALIRDESYNNVYHRIMLKQDQIKFLFFILFITLGLIFTMAWFQFLPLDEEQLNYDWKTILSVMLFGLLGGCVSALLSLASMPTGKRIPEQIANFLITLIRTFIGAAAALIAFIFMKAGILNFITPGVPILVICFAAGFSERFLKRALESVFGKD